MAVQLFCGGCAGHADVDGVSHAELFDVDGASHADVFDVEGLSHDDVEGLSQEDGVWGSQDGFCWLKLPVGVQLFGGGLGLRLAELLLNMNLAYFKFSKFFKK